MPKMKSHRGATKRFSLTASGKVKFKHAHLRHCLEHSHVHPEFAYMQLARLTAQLCTSHGRLTANEVPTYTHRTPGVRPG